MKKNYVKNLFKSFFNNIVRILTIVLITMLGIAFITGLGAVAPTLNNAINTMYSADNIYDINLKCTSPTGFSLSQINGFTNLDFVQDYQTEAILDISKDGQHIRICYMPKNFNINKLQIVNGAFPTSENEILVERPSDYLKSYDLHQTVVLNNKNYTVSGIVASPAYFAKAEQPSSTGEALNYIVYINEPAPYNIVTDVFLTIKKSSTDYFSKNYQENVKRIADSVNYENTMVLTLEHNVSYKLCEVNISRIETISYILPVFFVLVVLLVVLITITRLIEKDRASIACLSTIGQSKFNICFKYLFIIFLCMILGCVGGLFLGSLVLTPIIYNGYNTLFFLASGVQTLFLQFGAIASGVLSLFVLAITLGSVLKLLKLPPAQLFNAKAPKLGKKILLERMPFLWNKLKFKYKSTLRNIFRYKSRLIMTIISVAGTTAMVFAGLALFNAAQNMENVFTNMADSVINISIFVVVCALLLSILVIYNLTNINIEERVREIATLKVLGYGSAEVAMYIFRETIIMCIFGASLGLPIGVVLVKMLFAYIEFGSLSSVGVLSYFLTFLLSVLFCMIVNLLLCRKIAKVNMNTSLKTLD